MKTKRANIALVAVVAFVLAAFAGFATAQGGTPPVGSSLSFNGGTGTCDTPAPGKTIFCGTTTSVFISVNGGPFVDVKGATGPAGPQGVAGAVGAAGVGSTFTLNGKTCTATFDGMTQDGKGSGGFIVHLGTCQ